jgi:hypothetical protein
MSDSIAIGTIVRSESHVRYTCQVYSPGEVATPPQPADYSFGRFVRIPLRATFAPTPDAAAFPPRALPDVMDADAATPLSEHGDCWAVGLIYDTILLNPAFGALGPRLSSDTQNALFAPDYLAERAVLVSVLLLGTLTFIAGGAPQIAHGVPSLAPDLGAPVATLPDADLRAFHHFSDGGFPGGARAYLHMGYLPHAIAQDNPLLPVAMLRTIERLEQLFPENRALLAIVKRNFAWRLKIQAAG